MRLSSLHRICRLRDFVLLHSRSNEARFLQDATFLDDRRDVYKLLKGPQDVLTCAGYAWSVSEPGSLRRCAGTGDILAGVVGALLAWETLKGEQSSPRTILLASAVVRRVSRAAFRSHRRQTSASAVLQAIVDDNLPWTGHRRTDHQ